MEYSKEKYINPFTDYGFKKLFGGESNKDLLLDFLSELLREYQGKIKNITHLKLEKFSNTAFDHKMIFDFDCEDEKGKRFIVDLQKPQPDFFQNTSVYRSMFLIRQYKTATIYIISLLDFIFNLDEKASDKFRYNVKLMETETNRHFDDRLTFIYLEMPKFNKPIDELETRFDKWLFVLRNLTKLDKIPEKLQDSIFEKLFETAEIAKFTPEQVRSYEESLKHYLESKKHENKRE